MEKNTLPVWRTLINGKDTTAVKVTGLTIAYIFLQVLALLPKTEMVFAFLLLFTILFAVKSSRFDLLTVVFPLILLQHAYPGGTHTSAFRNWIYANFLFPVSMVHVLTLSLGVIFLVEVVRQRSIIMDKITISLAVLLGTALFAATLIDPYELFVDFLLLVTVLVYALYIKNVQNQSQTLLTAQLFFLTPVAISLGTAILFMIDVLFGTEFHTTYSTVFMYLFAILIPFSLGGNDLPKYYHRLYLYSTLLYFGVFFTELLNSGSGTGAILVIMSVSVLEGVKKWEESWFIRGVSLSIILVSTVYLSLYYMTEISLPLDFLIYKFLSVWSLNLATMEHSPAIRVIELLNIVNQITAKGAAHILFGEGFGGYFTDSFIPFTEYVELRPSDFSRHEISTGRFFRPHTLLGNYILLKYGLLGVFVFAGLAMNTFRKYMNTDTLAGVLPLMLLLEITSFGFGIKNSIILGIALGLWAKIEGDVL